MTTKNTKKRLELSVNSSLFKETPKQSSSGILNGTATSSAMSDYGTLMPIAIEKVDFFDGNPRTYQNPIEYEKIKASIKQNGVKSPVHITKRPEHDTYVLAQGGNTRLKAVKELYNETQDARFSTIPAILVSYKGERDIRLQHLIENEHRQEMIFWDKAVAYNQVIKDFQDDANEKGLKPYTLRELSNLLKIGADELEERESDIQFVSHTMISTFTFAVDNLSNLNRNLLVSLQNRHVTAIRKILNVWKKALDDSYHVLLESFIEDFNKSNQSNDIDDYIIALRNDLEKNFLDSVADKTLILEAFQTNPAEAEIESIGRNYQIPKEEQLAQEKIVATETASNDETTIDFDEFDKTNSSEAHKDIQSDSHSQTELNVQDGDSSALIFLKSIQNLLKNVGLEKLYVEDKNFKYGFYIDYPNIEEISGEFNYAIDSIHSQAGNVWAFVSIISGQEQLLVNPILGKNNPILNINKDTLLYQAYQNVDQYERLREYVIGNRPDLASVLIDWQTNITSLSEPVRLVLAALKEMKKQ